MNGAEKAICSSGVTIPYSFTVASQVKGIVYQDADNVSGKKIRILN